MIIYVIQIGPTGVYFGQKKTENLHTKFIMSSSMLAAVFAGMSMLPML